MLEITWLGHGSFLFRFDSGEVAIVDPWINGNPKSPAGFKLDRLDVMLLTHGHFDHVADAISLAKQFNPKIVANYEICTWLASKGVKSASGMNKGGSQQAGPVKVTMTHALHSSGIDDNGTMVYGGEAGGYMLHLADGRTVYFAGDTAIFSEMALYAELYKPQLAFLPIGDLFTMSPQEAAMAARMVKAPKVIPMHFGTFPPLVGTPEQLTAELSGSGIEVWPLEPGKSVTW